ncbi:hypothetical protein [Flagellimonas sp. GZD32]|uniref:hypothetical protein n=1 Tax=Flagellimonas cixiensis TaxID=3228750 RepID=UPI0035C8AC19
MKKPIILLTVLFHLGGCSKDDEYVVDVALSGEWTLNSASCFCYFGDDFDFSDHRLTFDSSEQKVVVQNSEKTSFITESGTYTFGNNGRILNINGRKYSYEISGDDLQLTFVDDPAIADDEIALFYTRN